MKLTPDQLDRLERLARQQARFSEMAAVTPFELLELVDGYRKAQETTNDAVPAR